MLIARETYVFHDWDEFLSTVESTPRPSYACATAAEARDAGHGAEWSGTNSLPEAFDLARKGWHDNLVEVEQVAGQVEQTITTDLFQTTFEARYDVAGAEVDLGRFLSGEPECMVESLPIRISRQGRAVRVVVPGVYASSTKKEAILNRGAAVVALADLLARAQHPLEVWVSYTVAAGSGKGNKDDVEPDVGIYVKVQAANEALDVPRLMFAIAHPASPRRIGFAAFERLIRSPDMARAIGVCYGYAVGRWVNDLPDQTDNTIGLPLLRHTDQTWLNRDTCATWVKEQLEGIFNL